jgi:heme-degrading monooxygenase HmoA
MQDKVQNLISRIVDERERQKTLPGSEWDSKNSVNDWIAIASHYLTQQAKRKGSSRINRGGAVTQEDFEDDLIKAAAVILAALEYSDHLKNNGELS